MGRLFILVLALTAIWLLLSGIFDVPLLLALGAASVVLCAFLAQRAGVLDSEGVPGGLMPRVFGYWLWLGGEITKANLIVARHALAVEPRLSPKMIRVPIRQKSNAGRATFANSVTLTPGTVAVDVDGEYLLIHALTEQMADEEGIIAMGDRVARLERPFA